VPSAVKITPNNEKELPFMSIDKNKSPWRFRRDNEPDFRGYDTSDDEIITDVLGSYTGTPCDGSVPVQDADDL
jgi:hypothetical protein